jgi:hypothetical protein
MPGAQGGTYNTGVQVRLQDGRNLVVKISPPSTAPGLTYEAGLLPTEADYFRRALPLGVPVPEVLAAGTGVIPGRDHLVMSMLPGRPWWKIPQVPSGAGYPPVPTCHVHRRRSASLLPHTAPPWLRSNGLCSSIGTSGTAISS